MYVTTQFHSCNISYFYIFHPDRGLSLSSGFALNHSHGVFANGKHASLKIRGNKHTREALKSERAPGSFPLIVSSASLSRLPASRLREKTRSPCLPRTSLSCGINLPRRCASECLHVVAPPQSLVHARLHSDPLSSTRAVIDLHLSLNLHEDEDVGV